MSLNECGRHPGYFGESDIQTGYRRPCRLCEAAGWAALERLAPAVGQLLEAVAEQRKITAELRRKIEEWNPGDSPAVLAIAARAVEIFMLREHGMLSHSDEKYAQSLAAEALREGT